MSGELPAKYDIFAPKLLLFVNKATNILSIKCRGCMNYEFTDKVCETFEFQTNDLMEHLDNYSVFIYSKNISEFRLKRPLESRT